MSSIQHELNDDILILFSDVLVSKVILEKCMRSNDDFNLIIDKNNITDKTMRVLIKDESIYDMGSHINHKNGDANFIGIAKYSKNGADLLRNQINKLCLKNFYKADYYTKAIIEIADRGKKINFTLSNGSYWNEIDYLEDFLDVKNNFDLIKDKIFGV